MDTGWLVVQIALKTMGDHEFVTGRTGGESSKRIQYGEDESTCLQPGHRS